MEIALILAMDEQGAIGYQNNLPWQLPDDLKHFKQQTLGHHLVLGRRSYESIGRPLPGRQMIVLSRNPNFQAPGCQVATGLEEALTLARQAGEELVFIAGGAAVFAEALPLANHLYLTRIHARVKADTYFVELKLSGWQLVEQRFHPKDDRHRFAFTIYHYRR
ncbi:MAG: dihydrofolate reductase [Anaerolineales bacterium]|nr:dihydrofolate reductase [Anaerolineales bacterium]